LAAKRSETRTNDLRNGEQQNLEEKLLFNNYADVSKQLRFDNVSSTSMMLSKSDASSLAIGTGVYPQQKQRV